MRTKLTKKLASAIKKNAPENHREEISQRELLESYLNLYYLKPFDAINDAANASSLRQFDWKQPICEIGTGDGVFSFIMQGGSCFLESDRYDHFNPKIDGDIYKDYD